jgi:hypothetical protein
MAARAVWIRSFREKVSGAILGVDRNSERARQKCAREFESDVEEDDGEGVSLVPARKDEV